MKYALAKYVLYDDKILEIREDEYESINVAKNSVIEAMCIEEKYNIALGNFLELERELLNPDMIFRLAYSSGDLFDIKMLINRRVVNLLSSCRMYIDHVKYKLSEMSEQFGVRSSEINRLFSNAYDEHLGYKIMEAVRNFSQHRDLPIEKIKLKSVRDEDCNIALSIYISSSVEYFRQDGEFKKDVLRNIGSIGSDVDMRKMIREYVSGLSSVHLSIRNVISQYVQKYDNILVSAIRKYKEEFGYVDSGDVQGLSVVKIDSSGNFTDIIYIMGDWISRRKQFEWKNKFIQNLQRRYITGK